MNRQTSCPFLVKVVVVYLAVIFGWGAVQDIAHAEWQSAHFCIRFTVTLLIELTVTWFIFRGKNWARWALLVLFVVGLTAPPGLIQQIRQESGPQIAVHVLLLAANLGVFFILFLHSSSQWFLRDRRKQRGKQQAQAEIEVQVRREHEQQLSETVDHWQKIGIEKKIAQIVKDRMKLVRNANDA